jgi:short-subunit dehydrogenase
MAKPRTLITGASSGIGAGLADAFAARGEDLVLVARSGDVLERNAAALREQYGIAVDVIAADLAQPDAAPALAAETRRREIAVGALVNNAGFATYGRFAELDPARERDEVMVNVLAPVLLTRAYLPDMLARGAGLVLNVASTAAFQPTPYETTYGATKAFVLSFTEGLAEELRGSPVRVVALCPGATATEFFTGIEGSAVGRKRTIPQVVRTAMRAIDRGRVVAVDGAANAVLAFTPRLSPRWMVRRIAGTAIGKGNFARTSR